MTGRGAALFILVHAAIIFGLSIPEEHWVIFSAASFVMVCSAYYLYSNDPETAPLRKRRLRLQPGEIVEFYDTNRIFLRARLMVETYTESYGQPQRMTLVGLDKYLDQVHFNNFLNPAPHQTDHGPLGGAQ